MSNTIDTSKTTSVAAWKKEKRIHPIVLHSGAVVKIAIPDLPALLEAGEIPQNLLEQALGTQPNEKPSVDSIKREREFRDVLVRLTVVEPKLSPEDVKDIPAEDKEILVEFATRQRDTDAEGNHIGGLTKSDTFRASRGLPSINSILEGASGGW